MGRSDRVTRAPRQASLNVPVLAVSLLATLLTGLVPGLSPAWQSARANLEESWKDSSRANITGVGRRRVLAGLIALETALSVILLASAGLLIRSFGHLLDAQLGFQPGHVLTLQIPSEWTSLTQRNDPAETERKMQYFHDIVEKVRMIPGVNAAGVSTVLPLANRGDEQNSLAIPRIWTACGQKASRGVSTRQTAVSAPRRALSTRGRQLPLLCALTALPTA